MSAAVGLLWWVALSDGMPVRARLALLLAIGLAADMLRSVWNGPWSLGGVVLALLGAVALTLLLVDLGGGPVRTAETRVAVSILHVASVDVLVPAHAQPGEVLVARASNGGYAARLTQSTSSAVPLAGLTALAVFAGRGGWRRHAGGYLAAAGLVLAINQVRIVTTLVVGDRWGPDAMVVYNGAAGTMLAALCMVGGLLLFYRVALGRPVPSVGPERAPAAEELACTQVVPSPVGPPVSSP